MDANYTITSENTILQKLNQYEPQSLHHELPVIWELADGCEVWGQYKGKSLKFIDFTSGILVANVGHKRPEIMSAINRQPVWHNYAFPNERRAELVEKLCKMSGMEKCYLCTTGSEAVEAALRIMKWKKKSPYPFVASLEGAFHGHTLGAKGLGGGLGKDYSSELTYDMTPHAHLERNINGIIFETYFGWSAQFHPVEWVQKWCNWAQENNIPVCFDEVQSGFGRTGKLFGFEHYGVKPDLIVVGKALGGGLPISAVLGRADLLDAPDNLSSTHTGNPVCCAAALETLKILEKEKLVERASWLGDSLFMQLYNTSFDSPAIAKLTGRGMVYALHVKDYDTELTDRIIDKAAEKGLLLLRTRRGTIKICPPLTISIDMMMDGVNILREAIEECQNG